MDDLVPDGATLLALLQGAEHLIGFYSIRPFDTIEEIAGCLDAAMQDAKIAADLPVIADAVGRVQAVMRPAPAPPADRELICAGFALIGGDARDVGQAVALVERGADQLAAVVALAMGIDPTGEYAVRRVRRASV
jgi:hypothetical protein